MGKGGVRGRRVGRGRRGVEGGVGGGEGEKGVGKGVGMMRGR